MILTKNQRHVQSEKKMRILHLVARHIVELHASSPAVLDQRNISMPDLAKVPHYCMIYRRCNWAIGHNYPPVVQQPNLHPGKGSQTSAECAVWEKVMNHQLICRFFCFGCQPDKFYAAWHREHERFAFPVGFFLWSLSITRKEGSPSPKFKVTHPINSSRYFLQVI